MDGMVKEKGEREREGIRHSRAYCGSNPVATFTRSDNQDNYSRESTKMKQLTEQSHLGGNHLESGPTRDKELNGTNH
jgi:hypothetical protein